MLSSEAIRQKTRLSLNILGNLTLQDDHGRHIKISNRKACGLLAYLAVNDTTTETRERLAGLLWSDRGEEQARASLRQCLKQLRTIFDSVGFTGFETDRQEVSLAHGHVDIDVQVIAADLENGKIPRRLLSEGCEPHRILYGFESLDQSFAAWLHVIRQNWHDRLVDHLQRLLRRSSGSNAKRAAEALVKIDPTHEEAHRLLIRHYADDGNITGALTQYKALWELLDEEFDMEPDDDTQALIAEIKSGTYVPAEAKNRGLTTILTPHTVRYTSADTATAKPTRLPVIGVSAFAHACSSEPATYLVEGFRRELIASLVRFREWTVVEGNELGAVAHERSGPSLKSDYQLEGVYVEEAEGIRQIVTLKDQRTNQFVWSEKLSIVLDNWFANQRELVRRISIALNIYLSVERLAKIASVPDISLSVYDRWLRGQALSFKWRPEVRDRATRTFESIIKDAPNFAPAYSSLVQLKNSQHLVFPGIERSKATHMEALSLAKRVVEIDPLDSRGHLCLAWSHAMNDSFNQAGIYFRLALSLNDNDPWTMVSAALGLAYIGETNEARKLADKALDLNFSPSSSYWGYQAGVRFMCEDYAECVRSAERARDRLYYLPGWKTAALAHMGRIDEARSEGKRFCDLVASHWFGQHSPEQASIAKWLIHSFPIRVANARERLRTGLAAAGVVVD